MELVSRRSPGLRRSDLEIRKSLEQKIHPPVQRRMDLTAPTLRVGFHCWLHGVPIGQRSRSWIRLDPTTVISAYMRLGPSEHSLSSIPDLELITSSQFGLWCLQTTLVKATDLLCSWLVIFHTDVISSVSFTPGGSCHHVCSMST